MKGSQESSKCKRDHQNAWNSRLRKARARAMLLYLEQCDEFHIAGDVRRFVEHGWTVEAIEMALDDLARAGKVEFSGEFGAPNVVTVSAHLLTDLEPEL